MWLNQELKQKLSSWSAAGPGRGNSPPDQRAGPRVPRFAVSGFGRGGGLGTTLTSSSRGGSHAAHGAGALGSLRV